MVLCRGERRVADPVIRRTQTRHNTRSQDGGKVSPLRREPAQGSLPGTAARDDARALPTFVNLLRALSTVSGMTLLSRVTGSPAKA